MKSIAIDGPAGAGKSTLARKLANVLGFCYVDTGAIYRTVALAVVRRGIDPTETGQVAAILPSICLDLRYDEAGVQHMYLDGKDVSDKIRLHEISQVASQVSAIPEVRAFLLNTQRELAAHQNVVMDGRDIGTVVLPDASVKIFLTASEEVRANRRFLELRERGQTAVLEDVLRDIRQRDEQDRNRPVAPLCQAEGAVVCDTSDMNLEESLQALIHITEELQT